MLGVTGSLLSANSRGVVRYKSLFLTAMVILGSTGNSKADFFDDLFGGAEPQSNYSKFRAHREYHSKARRSFSVQFITPSEKGVSAHRHGEKNASLHRGTRKSSESEHVTSFSATSAEATKKNVSIVSLCYPANLKDEEKKQLDPIVYDKTLRKGDTVMTAEGVQVFNGSRGCPHKADDFSSIKVAEVGNRKARSALLEIDKASSIRPAESVQSPPPPIKDLSKTASNEEPR